MEEASFINEDLVQRLMEMGFSVEEASMALMATNNSIEDAIGFLLLDEPVINPNEAQEVASAQGLAAAQEITSAQEIIPAQEVVSDQEPEISEPHLLEDDEWEDVDEEESADEGSADPIKMIIAVNTEFKMSMGKTASQVAHAAVGLYSQVSSNKRWYRFLRSWNEDGSKKIVVDGRNTATLKLLAEKAKKLKIKYCAIRDTGLTEVPPNSLTAVAVFGKSSSVNKVTGQLPLLK